MKWSPCIQKAGGTGIPFPLMVYSCWSENLTSAGGRALCVPTLPYTYSALSENARCNGFTDVVGSLQRHRLSNTFTNATKLLITSLGVIKASLITGITVTHDNFPNHLSLLQNLRSMELKTGRLGLVYQQCLEVRTTHHFYIGWTPQSSLV